MRPSCIYYGMFTKEKPTYIITELMDGNLLDYLKWGGHSISTKTDVSSFGVVMYEILTYGHFPYPGMTNSHVIDEVQQGYRMPPPQGLPDMLIQRCLKAAPVERYTFAALNSLLSNLVLSCHAYFCVFSLLHHVVVCH